MIRNKIENEKKNPQKNARYCAYFDNSPNNLEDERPVGDENRLTGLHGARHLIIRYCKLLRVALERVIRREEEGLPLLQFNLVALGKEAGANLRTLRVQQNSNVLHLIRSRFSQALKASTMRLMVAMGKVETGLWRGGRMDG